MSADRGSDDVLIFDSPSGQQVDTRELELAKSLVQQMAAHLESCEAALGRFLDAPHYSIGPHLPFDLPAGDPAWTWAEVENAVFRVRFEAGGIGSVGAQIAEFRTALAVVGNSYVAAETAISRRFKLGAHIGQEPATELLWFLLALNEQQPTEHSGLNLLAIAKMSVKYTNLPGFSSSVLRSAAQRDAVDELAAVVNGTAEISGPPEEFIAMLFGIYAGLKTSAAMNLAVGRGFYPAPPLGLLMPGALEQAIRAAAVDSEQEIQVRKLTRTASRTPPARLSDLAERIGEQYTPAEDAAQFAIEVIEQPDGRQAARVYLAGTAHALLHETHPNDARGNIQAIQGLETEQSRAVKVALAKLDFPAGTSLAFSGHSKGGMDALNLATDPEVQADYNVVSVETFGSPAELLVIKGLTIVGARARKLPRGTEFLSITHSGDPVPGFDISPPRGGTNKTEIRLSEKAVAAESNEHPIVEAHAITTYRGSAARLESAASSPLARWEGAAAPALAQPGATSVVHVFEVQKLPQKAPN